MNSSETPSLAFDEIWQLLGQQIAENFPGNSQLAEFRLALAERQLERLGEAITFHLDLQREAVRRYGMSFTGDCLENPFRLKAQIAECDRAIRRLQIAAAGFAAQLGWKIEGAFSPETGCYQFQIKKLLGEIA